jgi:tryptophan 2,3-dioxygenase
MHGEPGRPPAAAAEENYEEPILPGTAPSDYERYLRTEDLLALQKRPEEMVHRDELLFQVVHQTSELWLKLATTEVFEAARLVEEGDVPPALRLLRRANDCIAFITNDMHMLEHMSPWEYTEIRRVLGHGSGFDSPGFVAVREASERLGRAFTALREREGLSVADIYRQGREREDLYQLAELMLGWDEKIINWRSHHIGIVERSIGVGAVGTQGTPVDVLQRLTRQQRFPELWAARDELTKLAGL